MKQLLVMIGLVLTVQQLCCTCVAEDPALGTWKAAPADKLAVPQNLLKLIHTPEVQRELKLARAEEELLLDKLVTIDGPWWRSRNLAEPKRRAAIAQLEQELIQTLSTSLPRTSLDRLRQIELQSQGSRALARPDVVHALQLTSQQTKKLNELFGASLAIEKKMEKAKGEPSDALNRELKQAAEAEARGIEGLLTPPQRRILAELIGTSFDTQSLTRIYPFAPELIDSQYWVNDPVNLQELRGRVVLLHFYAFQCHNCVANFTHYNSWHQRLSDRGVTVLGIQSPELAAERDVNLVRQAAAKSGFQFPVLIDKDMKNWDAWGNTMWPTVYVIDKRGYIRHWWQGELNWQGATGDKTIEAVVEKLLAEAD